MNLLRALVAFVVCLVPVAAAAEPTRSAVAVLPLTGGDAAQEELALVIQDRATALVQALGPYDVFHARQLLSMLQRHQVPRTALADPTEARRAAERMGASYFAFGSLTADKAGGYQLQVTAAEVGSARSTERAEKLPANAGAAVEQASRALAGAILELSGQKPVAKWPAVQPSSGNDGAMKAYAHCAAVVLGQPISLETPTVLVETDRRAALDACQAALKADPQLHAARAAQALALAVGGEEEKAVQVLRQVPAGAPFMPNQVLARFWSVTHFQSAQAGEAVLKEALAQNSGFLLGKGYLAELYSAVGRYADAAAVWQDYAKQAPDSPFLLSRLAYTLARMGKAKEAVAYAEKAMAFDPGAPDLSRELASRYIDAGMPEKAIARLEPFARKSDASAELVLVLGYAQYLAGRNDSAEKMLQRAFDAAKEPSQWRTRGRAKLDLAALAWKKGDKARARALMLDSLREGLQTRPVDEAQRAALATVPDNERAEAIAKALRPREASPFAQDAAGEINPSAKPPVAPKDFEPVKAR